MTAVPLLSRRTDPGGPGAALPERVLQFGEGVFLRAYLDWMIDVMNRQGRFQGTALVIKPRPHGAGIDELNAQDGLFTVWTRGLKGEQAVDECQVQRSISRGLNPALHWQDYLKAAAQPELRFVFSNTTEAGLVYREEAEPSDACPAGFPAKLTAFLYQRYQVFKGEPAKGMVILPLELVEENGLRLKEAVLMHARDWALEPAFLEWLQRHNRFINTLVDRIVPGKPAEAPKDLPYRDELLVACEPFHLLVIQAEEDLGGELPLSQAGLNVRWVQDLAPYRELKVRMLNGAHSAMASLGYLHGRDTVAECLEPGPLNDLLQALIFEEAALGLRVPVEEALDYGHAVLERFRNPLLSHRLESIALNASAKFRTRLLPILDEHVARTGKAPDGVVKALAALFVYEKPVRIVDGVVMGRRQKGEYAIRDEASALAYFGRFWAEMGSRAPLEQLCEARLADKAFWGQDLSQVKGLAARLAHEIRLLVRLERVEKPS